MKYSEIRDFVQSGLASRGYSTLNPNDGTESRTMPVFDPGPVTIPSLLAKYPTTVVFLTVGNGIGLTVEEIFDQPFITVRVIGLQGNYDYAEQLAYDVDDILLAVDHNTIIGQSLTLRISRTGGPPQLIDFDSGSRYHFQNTYVAETER